MKTFKKASALFLAALMLAAQSACQSASKTENAPAGTAAAATQGDQAAQATQEASLKPYQLNCYFLAPQVKDLPMVQEKLSELLTDRINATIKLNYFWFDSYTDKQKLVIASGEAVDTMFVQGFDFNNYVPQKAFLPLDSLIAEYGKNITANINPLYLLSATYKGEIFAIPTQKDMFGVGGVLVNKALADKYGFDFSGVKVPADFEPMLKTIKENEPGIIPLLSTQGDHTVYFTNNLLAMVSWGISHLKTDPEAKVKLSYEFPESIELTRLAEDWYKKGYVNNDVATLQDGMPQKKAQKAFMWAEQLKPGKAEEMSAQLGYELIQVYAHNDMQYYTSSMDLTASMLAINRTSKDPERAMMFIDLLFHDKEVKNLLDWGIEGVHYKKVNENQIDYADGVTAETSGYTGLGQWAMGGSQLIDYLWVNEAPDKWEKMQEFNDSCIPTSLIGFAYSQDNVKSEAAAVSAIVSTQMAPLASGIVNYDEYWPTVRKQLEDAGVNKVLEDAQRQVDEFIASQK
ncbi:MAG: ABC transporter substrate-binding protein [Clostridiales bacterium]|jgi:putative aldouronate transport system substrate-binding protein|nr:ABC transporter substrate-binding protein [Clostridiales bacterium]